MQKAMALLAQGSGASGPDYTQAGACITYALIKLWWGFISWSNWRHRNKIKNIQDKKVSSEVSTSADLQRPDLDLQR